MTKKVGRNNPVAKHARKINKSHVHVDRKKESKKNPKFIMGDSDEYIRIR